MLGVGIDIVDVSRISSLRTRYGDRFLARIFTRGEAAYCESKHDPSRHLAARFAAKEAAMKALGTGFARGVKFTDIEVCKGQGQPRIVLHGKALELSEDLGVFRMHISISHDRLYATALVILEGDG
ncbi:MAG TPA: holo-ACP synthase [Deltaproteobacteria bacterium]|nr:holo-ACP synthase [Deltaproteobacteria bacterium]HQI02477.1 holo-ACP synthase [Deltaproteobacteria bacterium]